MDIMEMVRNKRAAIQASSGRREKTVKPNPGKNRFRILPGWRGGEDKTFFHDFGQHFIKNAAGELKAVYVCTDKTYGKPCAVCDAIGEGLRNTVDDNVTKALTEGKSKGRILLNALHLDGDDANTPVILDLSPTTAEKVFELMDEYGNITDLDKGLDIIITRTGKGLNTEYSVMPAAKSEPVPASIMSKLHNLDDYVKQEYDEGRNKALAQISEVSGLLPASTASVAHGAISRDVPTTPMPSAEEMEDALEASYEEMPTKSAEAAPATKPAMALGDDISEDDLDALLDELG